MIRFKKIRGFNRRIEGVKLWRDEALFLDTERLLRDNYEYTKVYVSPWDGFSLTNSQFPEPKSLVKNEILKALELIYENWKIELEKLNQPYYLKIWLYEPRISKSQVVCAIGEKIAYYEHLFQDGNFCQNNSSFTNSFSSEFQWEAKIDQVLYWQNDFLFPLESYVKAEEFYSDQKFLKNLKKRNYYSEEFENVNGVKDVIYFQPKGKIWVGEKS